MQMKLYSEQSHDLSITGEPRKRELGTYADTPRIAHAQTTLYDELLGTDQVVWCLLEPQSRNVGTPKLLHVIDGNEADIVAILDGMVWEWIIGQNCIPQKIWDEIRFSTNHLRAPERDKRREELKADYARTHLPDDLWGSLLSDDISCRMPQVLLGWPLKKSSIIDIKPW